MRDRIGAFWALVLWVGAWASGCAALGTAGTPMSSECGEVPTVEECRSAARDITDECLRGCIHLQCAGIKINCGEYVQKECKKHSAEGLTPFGYVFRTSETTCDKPVGEINWCELSASRECRAKAMVHELAHACGWAHNEGLGVPSNEGFIQCE